MTQNTHRIGIFGGSFNPPTIAHKALADFVFQELSLDRLLWVVSPHNPDKDPATLAEFQHRYRMVDRYLNDRPHMQPDDIEQKNNSSWTIDTVRSLRALYPDDALFFITGADNWLNFHLWGRDFEDILRKNVSMIVLERPGYDNVQAAESSKIFADLQVEDTDHLKPFGSWCIVKNPTYNVAATQIREALQQGKPPENLDQDIYNYIKENNLYGYNSD